MASRNEDIKTVRNRLGCGLREAVDAIDKYGTAEAALKALSPDLPASERDPYAEAVASRERYRDKASAYRSALQRILNIDADPETTRLAKEGLYSGDNV